MADDVRRYAADYADALLDKPGTTAETARRARFPASPTHLPPRPVEVWITSPKTRAAEETRSGVLI
jgi:hypothetical protein